MGGRGGRGHVWLAWGSSERQISPYKRCSSALTLRLAEALGAMCHNRRTDKAPSGRWQRAKRGTLEQGPRPPVHDDQRPRARCERCSATQK